MADLNQSWIKISLGLSSANVPPNIEKAFKELFLSPAFRHQAEAIVNGISTPSTASRKPADEERRLLSRAMNFLEGVDAYINRRPYVEADKNLRVDRKFIEDLSSPVVGVKKRVQNRANEVYRQFGNGDFKTGGIPVMAVMEPMPDVSPSSLTPGPEHLLKPAGPTALALDPPRPKRLRMAANRVIAMNKAAAAFQSSGRENRANNIARANQFVVAKEDKLMHSWTTARSFLVQTFSRDQVWFLYNHANFNSAISTAYRDFRLSVEENQALIKARVDLLKKLFTGLKMAPPPLSFVGMAGELALSQAKVQTTLDPRQGLPEPNAHNSGFVQRFLDKVEELQKQGEIGPVLGNLATDSALLTGLDKVCASQLKIMQKALDTVCTERFGDATNQDQKMREFLAESIERQYDAYKGFLGAQFETKRTSLPGMLATSEEGMLTAMRERIDRYRLELEAEIRANFMASPGHEALSNMKAAIEMSLYCAYIKELYASDAMLRGAELHDNIVNFFARSDAWGILSKDAHQASALAETRLSWKGGYNHKKALHRFCTWYVETINPFLMVSGRHLGGKPYSAKLIQELIRMRVRRINIAIDETRTKGLFGSNWDWDRLDEALKSRKIGLPDKKLEIK